MLIDQTTSWGKFDFLMLNERLIKMGPQNPIHQELSVSSSIKNDVVQNLVSEITHRGVKITKEDDLTLLP